MRPPIFTPHFIHPLANSPSGKWTVRCRLSAWSHRLPFGLRSFNPPPMHTHVPLGLIINRRPPTGFLLFPIPFISIYRTYVKNSSPSLYLSLCRVYRIAFLHITFPRKCETSTTMLSTSPILFPTWLLGSRESRRFDRHELPLALGLVNEEDVYGIIINSIRQIVPGGY